MLRSGDHILYDLFTPIGFINPAVYLEWINEKLPNECDKIFDFKGNLSEKDKNEKRLRRLNKISLNLTNSKKSWNNRSLESSDDFGTLIEEEDSNIMM